MTSGFNVARATRARLYLEDRAKGLTYAQIAEKYGVTRQRVGQVCGQHEESKFRKVSEDQCVYVNIRQWMNANLVSMAELIRRMGGMPYGRTHTTIRSMLRGRSTPTKYEIDALINSTGLKYEVLFIVG